MRLHLLRHLAPLVKPGICYGRTDLAVEARRLEHALPGLRARLPAVILVISSPLARCASLAVALDANARFDARLAELDFGTWEMRSWDEIARAEVDAWAADVANYRPGGGQSVMDMALKVDDFYASLLRQSLAEAVIVCHAGTMRLLAARQAGLPPADMAREAAQHPHAIRYGEIITLDCV